MKSFRRLQIILAAALVIQFVVGLGGELSPGREIFPFFSWFLFVLVPSRTTEYDLLLRNSSAGPPPQPLFFTDGTGWVHQPHSIVVHQLIQSFGRAVEDGGGATAETLRRQIEAQFLMSDVRYDLVRVSFNPVDRWKAHRPPEFRVIHSYVSGQP